jgi:hypothetical protein
VPCIETLLCVASEQNNAMYAGVQHSRPHRPSLRKGDSRGQNPGYF